MAELAPAAIGSAVPIPRTRLIGREVERATARSLLLDDACPLVTLTGPGGAGKTRLALAIADDLADDFTDGVIWVDLAPLADASLVPATMARAFGIVPMPGLPIDEQLMRELRPRQALILLDNCEHVLDVTADLAADLLHASPALQILATSRAPLHVRGEQELPVEPFPLPAIESPPDVLSTNEAVRLFLERARAVSPRFALHETNAPTVAAICRQLEGLPLAIELAAARLKLLSVEALLAQMADRLRLLRGGHRDLPARQQTIRDTIAWSYTLLDPRQRAVFRQLAVFTGGWTVKAAAAVVGDDRATVDDVLDDIGALVDQSLVRRVETDAEPRFTMFETIREFGLVELTAAGEEEETRGRHANWFRVLVDGLDLHHTMQSDLARTGRLVPEQDNVRQALAWFAAKQDALALNVTSAAMSIFWPSLGQFAEARAWLHEAMACEGGVPDLTRARVWNEAGWLAMCQGELDTAAPLREQGLALSRLAGDPFLLAESILGAGTMAFWRGDLERAAALMEEGRQAFLAIGAEFPAAPVKAGAAVNFLGNIAMVSGDLPAAIQRGEEAVASARALRATADLGYALGGLGYARLLDGATPEAAACFVEAIAVAWTIHDDAFLSRLYWALAAVAVASGGPDVAAALIGAADALDARTGSAMWPADRVLADWCLARLKGAIDPDAFLRLRRAGAALATDQTIALAWLAAAMPLGEERVAAIWQGAGAPNLTLDGGEVLRTVAGGASGSKLSAIHDALSPREREVLELMSLRLTDAEIGARLFISPRTAQVHVASVLDKLGATTRRDAAAVTARWLVPEPISPGADLTIALARSPEDREQAGLTTRELDVLGQLFAGRTDREIADALFITRRTASKHVESILAKLGVHSRGAAVAEARRLGIVPALAADRDV